MPDCQIYHMDIIPHTGSVRCIIIVTEYSQFLELSNSNLSNIGHQIVGNTIRILSHGTALMGTNRIEVTKQNHIPLRVCLLNICQNLLQHGLCPAVRVCTLPLWTLLRNRDNCRIAINCRAGRKDNVLYTMLPHHINQRQRTGNIILIILPGLLLGFAYRL